MATEHTIYDTALVKLTPTGERFVREKRVADSNPYWLTPDSDGFVHITLADLLQFFGHLVRDGKELPIEFRFLLADGSAQAKLGANKKGKNS